MGAGRKAQTFNVNWTLPISSSSVNSSVCGRNLGKSQLGGVIFGCKNSTMKECQSKQLFGLPARHFSYVKNIDPGLPLFLFNYSDRKLHGIFEASSKGKMYIDPYAWTSGDCLERTQYPAQVQIRVRLQCHPLSEDKFGEIIANNYYTNNHFWFELDHIQTSKLMYLLASLAIAPGTPVPRSNMKWRTICPSLPSHETLKGGETLRKHESEAMHFSSSNRKTGSTAITSSLDGDIQPLDTRPVEKEVNEDEKNVIYMKLMELALGRELLDNLNDTPNENKTCHVVKGYPETPTDLEKKEESSGPPFEDLYTIVQLMQRVEELRTFKKTQTQKNFYLEHKMMKAALEIQHLKDRCTMLKCTNVEKTPIQSSAELHLVPKESLFLKADYDAESWLSALDLYFHSQNVIKSLKPVSSVRLNASVVQLNGDQLYAFGGGNGCVWYDTVESYCPNMEKWTLCPSLYQKKNESLAEVTFNNKIFAVGGANSVYCFSNVEMLDVDNGRRWISICSILEKRFDLDAVELNGTLCATGGYSGFGYLRYALGGFDKCTMVQSVKLFDHCLGVRVTREVMNHRGEFCDVALVKESINVIGGVKVGENIVDTFFEATEVVYGNNDGITIMIPTLILAIRLIASQIYLVLYNQVVCIIIRTYVACTILVQL